jgi:hypothetical protein
MNSKYKKAISKLFPINDKEKMEKDKVTRPLSHFHLYSQSLLFRGISGSKKTTQPIFESIFFHRVVIDEFDESHQPDKLTLAISLLHGSNYWGLTGTPKVSQAQDIVKMAKYLHVDIENRGTIAVCKEFIGKFMTKNQPDLRLPEKTESIVWVKLDAEERVLYNTVSVLDSKNRLDQMMCVNHYQLAGAIVDAVTLSFSSRYIYHPFIRLGMISCRLKMYPLLFRLGV